MLNDVVILRLLLIVLLVVYHSFCIFSGAWEVPDNYPQIPAYGWIAKASYSKMDVLLAANHPPRGELMEKAVRYLDNFRKQIFAYTKDGRYSIDNNIDERCIRPLTGERKNSLSFGSHRMARASVIYHTVIATCQMNKIPVLEYLKKCFRKKVKDYIQDDSGFLPQNIRVKPGLIY